MAKVLAYEVELRGIKGVVTSQGDLTKAIKETKKELAGTDFGTTKYNQLQKQLGSLSQVQKEQRAETRRQAREFEIAADKGKNSYRSLNAELVNLRNKYKELSAAERNLVGPDLLNRIGQLDKELKDIDASMGNYQRNVGNYANAFADLGGIDLSVFASGPAAVAAIGAAAVQAGAQVLQMTDDVRQLRGEIQNLTDAEGQELDSFTSRVLAISETFDESTKDITNAANAVATQLGIGFDEALTKIEEGFIAGSDQTGEFLDNLREYPAFFDEAELSADALFAVINRQATEGIFSDKGVDTIKEASLRLRELPTATRDALEAIGIDSEDIRKKIADEGVGAAIAQVSERLGELESSSPEVGQAIAGIFGGPGEDAGLDFLLSLQAINEETGSLIDTSNEYQLQQQKTLEVNQAFADAQIEVAEAIGGTGNTLDNVTTQIKTGLLTVLLVVVDAFKAWWEAIAPLRDAVTDLLTELGVFNEHGETTEAVTNAINKAMTVVLTPIKLWATALGFLTDRVTGFIQAGRDFLEWVGILGDEEEKSANSASGMAAEYGRLGKSIEDTTDAIEDNTEATKENEETVDKLSKSTRRAAVEMDAYAKGSVAALRDEISKLKKELDEVAPEDQAGILKKLIDAEGALEEVERTREELRNALTRDFSDAFSVGGVATLGADPLVSTTAIEERGEKIKEILEQQNADILEQEQLRVENLIEVEMQLLSGVAGVLNQIGAIRDNASDSQIAALERKYDKELELAEGNDERIKEIEEERDEEIQKIQKEAFERQKRLQTAQALISGAQAVVSTLAAVPGPVDIATLGAARALQIAFVGATTLAQIAAISSQEFSAAEGILVDGFARGETHDGPNKGIGTVLNGRRVRIEHGEFVDTDEHGNVAVVNKRSAAVFRGLLQSSYGKQFAGKGKMLSDVNNYAKYGVAFAAQGGLVQPNLASVSSIPGPSATYTAPVTISSESVDRIAQATGQAVMEGSREGVATGMSEASRNADRYNRLTKRTGI